MKKWILGIAVFVLVQFAIAHLFLAGANHSKFDTPLTNLASIAEVFESHPDDAAAYDAFMQEYELVREQIIDSKSLSKGLKIARDAADGLSDSHLPMSKFLPVTINEIPAEWAVGPGVNTKRRLLLLHGGAFVVGTPRGHRSLSDRLSVLANAAVLSLDYRLLPEHNRFSSVEDAQMAYQWLLENGPSGKEPIEKLFVAGDSAGGNLTLMLSNWSRDQNIRQADAVIAFSPSTDMTMSAPSLDLNLESDRLLGPSVGILGRIPTSIKLWLLAVSSRANPSNPLVSPLFANLNDLPPTLIHASSNEILLGDSIRYTNKARAAGSNVKLQIWNDQIHDWQLFYPSKGSGIKAWSEVEGFLKQF